MLPPMIPRLLAACAILPLSLLLCQCGSNEPGPVLIGQSRQMVAEGEALFAKAQAEESKGDLKGAIKLYDKTATEYPFTTSAGEARYRQALLLERRGEPRDAFEAYDKFLKHFPSHEKHGEALKRLADLAFAAQKGTIRTNFLGLKGKLPLTDIVEMLTKVKSHAPKTDVAARAQYAIAEAYHEDERYSQAVAAFRTMVEDHRNHPLAPEALFNVGKILLENAERGNQNQANLDLSREAFNDYLLQFPGHQRNAEARELIKSLGARDLQRSMEIADFYYKTGQTDSARIYYGDIVQRTTSGALHDKAQARLKELGN